MQDFNTLSMDCKNLGIKIFLIRKVSQVDLTNVKNNYIKRLMESIKSFLTPINIVVIVVLGIVVIGGGYFLFASNSATSPDQATTAEHESEEVMEDEDNDSMSKTMTVVLNEQNDSGQAGSASLIEKNGKTKVVILELDDFIAGVSQPAHLHSGTCLALGEVSYPLTNLIDGNSETVLDVDLNTLISDFPLALNVHKSTDEAGVYVACGDLK